MTNSKREYNEFIRANLPYGITYDSARYQYVTFNGKRFVTYLEAKWYIDYLTKFGGGPEDDIRNDLFGTSEEGVWFEANDSTTLFTDVAGTTPVTTPGDAVALQLDKSQGLTLGPELVTNGTFDSDAGWEKSGHWVISGGAATMPLTTGYLPLYQVMAFTSAKTYLVEFDVTAITGTLQVLLNDDPITSNKSNTLTVSATGRFSGLLTAQAGAEVLAISRTGGASSCTIDNISVKELPGNHRTQATTAARPLYALHPVGGVRNLLEYTEEFDNAYWGKYRSIITSNATTAPDGTTTADRLTADGSNYYLRRNGESPPNPATASIYVKKDVSDYAVLSVGGASCYIALFDLVNGTLVDSSDTTATSIAAVGDGWYRISISGTLTPSNGLGVAPWDSDVLPPSIDGHGLGSTTASIFIWGAQLEQSSTATNYQRVGSFLDVSEEGKARRGRIWYNGTSHFMQTPTITPGTDKVQVFAGVRKLSDAAGMMAELGSLGDFGSFFLISENLYGSASRGDVAASATQRANTEVVSGADSAVITTTHDIPADLTRIKRNGGTYSDATGDKGTGNFLAYPLYFGARAGTSLFFNGYEDTSIIRFGPNLDDTTISKVESYVASKTPEPTL